MQSEYNILIGILNNFEDKLLLTFTKQAHAIFFYFSFVVVSVTCIVKCRFRLATEIITKHCTKLFK